MIALAAVLVWGITDWRLGGAQSDPVPLLFNSAMRYGVFLVVVGLLARLKAVLAREIELARHDPLTGLPNRRMFYAEGTLALAQARRRHEPLTALFLDVDHFKRVNDELGHKAGDELLRAVAGGLRRQVRGSDVVGRLGGDEFAVLLPGMGAETALGFATKLKARLDASATGHAWAVGFSIGLACFREPPPDLETVLAQADTLMYNAKRAGRDTICRREFDGAAPAPPATDGP
jgi:diguanylate cyclase (GGDEF)-like protein